MWTYSQKTGVLSHDGEFVGRGYAGREAGKNNPEMQNVAATGPLPRGKYLILEPRDSDHVGRYAMPLQPDPANEMFGRSAFYIHGDNIEHPGTASHGCIVQARDVREKVWESHDHELQVTL